MNTPEMPNSQRMPVLHVVIYASLFTALIGSFLPWARVLFITINGTDGDGMITAIASLVALVCFYSLNRTTGKTTALKAVSLIAAVIAAGIYVYDFVNISSLAEASDDEFFDVSVTPQFGLIIGTAGALIAAIGLGKLIFIRPKPTKTQ